MKIIKAQPTVEASRAVSSAKTFTLDPTHNEFGYNVHTAITNK